MKTLLLVIFSLAVVVQGMENLSLAQEEHTKTLFEIFKEDFQKLYESDFDLEHRFNVFKQNLSNLFNHQETDKHGKYGVTQFADLSPEEFEEQYLSLASARIDESEIPQQDEDSEFGILDYFLSQEQIDFPKNFDWREKGALTDVKAQSSCGACWAFTTAAVLESQYFIKHGVLKDLSEQQLLDCDTINDGCGGGLMTDAYKFLQQEGKLETKEAYGGYKNQQQQCHFDGKKEGVKVVNYYQIAKDEDAIQKELYLNGPIAIGINGRFLQFYDGGVLNNEKCDDRINHAVLLVGWGEEDDGTKYWIIRNQWGPDWGNDGYFKLIRGEKRCGVHTYASIAFVE